MIGDSVGHVDGKYMYAQAIPHHQPALTKSTCPERTQGNASHWIAFYPGSRIHSKSMYGYPWKSKDIQMDIHKSMDNGRLISTKT